MPDPTQPHDDADAMITEATKRALGDVARGVWAVQFTRALCIVANILSCLMALSFTASQFAVLAACGRYMEWW